MSIYLQVSYGFNINVDKAMSCDLIEHVVKKREAGITSEFTGAIEIHGNTDLRFIRVSLDTCLALFIVAHSRAHAAALKRFKVHIIGPALNY